MMGRVVTLLLLIALSFSSWAQLADTSVTLPTGGTTVGGGVVGDFDDYFVDPVNGTDSGGCSGGTSSTPWRTLAQAQTCMNSAPTGSDLYLKAATVFEDQTFTVNWDGTATNRAIIGCYFELNGQLFRCTNDQVRPEINGTLEASCRTTYDCATGRTNNGPAVPSGLNDALLRIVGDYITVSYISLQDSAGLFADIEGYRVIYEHTRNEYAFSQVTYHTGGLGKEAIVRYNLFASQNWYRTFWDETGCKTSGPQPPSCVITFGSRPAGQGGVVVRNHRPEPAYILYHSNIFADYSDLGLNLGEGRDRLKSELFNCLQSTHTIFAFNVVYDWNPMYSDNCQYSIWEANASVAFGSPGGFIALTQEEYPPTGSSIGSQGLSNEFNMYRNNVIFEPNHCGQIGDIEQGSIDFGFLHGDSFMFGNTCLGGVEFGFNNRTSGLSGQSGFQPGAKMEIKSNAIFAPDATGVLPFWTNDPSCRVSYSGSDLDYNAFDNVNNSGNGGGSTPIADCRSNMVLSGDFMLATTYADRKNFSLQNPMNLAAGRPLVGSPLIGQGDPNLRNEELGWLTSSTFPAYITDELFRIAPGTCYTMDNWTKKLACDAGGNERPALPTIGAWEP